MHSDLLDIFYILSLAEDELDEYIESIELNGGSITSNGNAEIYTESQALICLFIEIFESLYFDYDYLNDIAQELIFEISVLFKKTIENDFYFLPHIFREISGKILNLLDIDVKKPQKSFSRLLNEYNFQIVEPSYEEMFSVCKDCYPFESLIENYETGKNLPISVEEKHMYGHFSKKISKQLESMLDNCISDLIKLENQPYDEKLRCVKDLINKLNLFNNEFKKENGYDLLAYTGAFEVREIVITIADTAGVKKEGFWELFSDWNISNYAR